MSVWLRDLLSSLDMQTTLQKVQNRHVLDFAHYSLLRDATDAKLYRLMGKIREKSGPGQALALPLENDLYELQDACVRMAHLLQSSCLALRRLQLEHEDQGLAREVLESQLAYMQACLDRSMADFTQHG
ncbi:hypothetical protein [Pseudomonas sp. PSKL.D1]|uniref:hypothetical protein n=1 Tax=Pseudomonas sp. PSKL.D1 TaxID=3029060 RepID=UPI00238173E2|nr:hypothetical protein [Pseudomonas sp. PSKL.D1]WDY56340.1 hypothetical protein PVV54_17250 [Pseudomonas sp. PSKL.D1]